MNKQSIIESLVFLGFSMGVFLPVRLLTVTYLSTWWVGSFGMITLTLIILLYLVKRNKLGWVGRIWQKKLHRLARGKLGIFAIVQSVLFILMFSSIVFLTDMNRGTEEVVAVKLEMEADGINNLAQLTTRGIENSAEASFDDWVFVFTTLITHPEVLGQVYAVFDDFSGGWHQHLNMVWLVEEVELLCLVLYFRYKRRYTITDEVKRCA